MKIGLLAYSTQTGLGYQTRDFAKNIPCEKILIVDLSKFNAMPTDHSWAHQPRIVEGIPKNEDLEWLVDGMDIVFVAETPLNHYLFEYARKKGVKTVMQYNFEFFPYFKRPDLAKPDVFAAPSVWHRFDMEPFLDKSTSLIDWPVPIDTDRIPFRKMTEVKTFVHIIGRPAAFDRNGTMNFLLAALQFKKKGNKQNYIVYVQRPKDTRANEHFKPIETMLQIAKKVLGDSLTIIENEPDNAKMYSQGEVLILPRKYGGLCLPMWEALSAGMPVIMTAVSPNNDVLPEEWLVTAKKQGSFMAHTVIDLYAADIMELCSAMDQVVRGIKVYNKMARGIAESMSWKVQKKLYVQRFEDIVAHGQTLQKET